MIFIKKLELHDVKINFVLVNHNPDPSFPNGIPNPLLEKNWPQTANVVIKEQADFGVAFDGISTVVSYLMSLENLPR